jgi:hypothetical protein
MRFTRLDLRRRKWLLPILVLISLPEPVYLNRLDAALYVFIFGIGCSSLQSECPYPAQGQHATKLGLLVAMNRAEQKDGFIQPPLLS